MVTMSVMSMVRVQCVIGGYMYKSELLISPPRRSSLLANYFQSPVIVVVSAAVLSEAGHLALVSVWGLGPGVRVQIPLGLNVLKSHYRVVQDRHCNAAVVPGLAVGALRPPPVIFIARAETRHFLLAGTRVVEGSVGVQDLAGFHVTDLDWDSVFHDMGIG